MTHKFPMTVTTADGTTEAVALNWSRLVPGTPTEPVTINIVNLDPQVDSTETQIALVRGDLLNKTHPSEVREDILPMGAEMVEELWLEYLDGATWTPINKTIFPGIAHGESMSLTIRINPPADAETLEQVEFAIAVRSR